MVQGGPDEVVRASGLETFSPIGPDVDCAARTLRLMPGVEAAAVLGSAVHIAGMERAALARPIASLDGNGGLVWQEVAPRLEDVFIHLLSQPTEKAA